MMFDQCLIMSLEQAVGAITVDTCDECGVGTFSDAEGTTQCTQCVKGTYSSSTGQPSNNTCTPCPAGKPRVHMACYCLKES